MVYPGIERAIIVHDPVTWSCVRRISSEIPEDGHVVGSPALRVNVRVGSEAAVVPVLVNWLVREVHVASSVAVRLLLVQGQTLKELVLIY